MTPTATASTAPTTYARMLVRAQRRFAAACQAAQARPAEPPSYNRELSSTRVPAPGFMPPTALESPG